MVNGELSIRNVMQSDSGMYSCVAENKYGTVYSNAELRVLGKYPLSVVPLLLSDARSLLWEGFFVARTKACDATRCG